MPQVIDMKSSMQLQNLETVTITSFYSADHLPLPVENP